MKKMKSFNLLTLTIFLILLLVIQPTTIVYYAKEEERQFWELVNDSIVQEGVFTDEPQEVVFVYRKRTMNLPSQMVTTKTPLVITPHVRKQKTQYAEILREVSGVFLFGSTHM